ncbi:hypothetical protein RHECNPAF_35000133 [Rhizobium etli CNPAF512]|nr:hypothetical protein RHECNPAF_35000133 [Rhizobium etli CNPAF512]
MRSTSLVLSASPSGLLSSVTSVISTFRRRRPPLRNVPGGKVGLRWRRTFGTEGVQLVPIAPEGEILALGKALEAFPHIDPAKIRMSREPDAIHVPGLTLVPVGGAPDSRDRRHFRRIAKAALDADPPPVGQRIEMVDRLEPRRFGIMIDPANVREEIELHGRMLFQEPAEFDDPLGRNGKDVDAVCSAEVLDCFSEALHDWSAIEGRLHTHDAITRSRGVPASARDLLIFS